MNNVHYLEEYRQRKWEQETGRWLPGGELPYVTDGSIWSKNYQNFDELMSGIIKIKQLMEHHLPYTEEWKYFLLTLMDQSFSLKGNERNARVAETASLMQQYLAEELNVMNKKDFSTALVILDLIAKSAKTAKKAQH